MPHRGLALKIHSANVELECLKSTGSGVVLSPTRVEETFSFTKCQALEAPCETPGHVIGQIETKPLLGVVGENASKEAFVSFTGMEAGSTEPAPQETFAEMECGGFAKLTLHGTVSGKWTEAVNKPTKTGGIQFTVASGEQDLIESTPFEKTKPPR